MPTKRIIVLVDLSETSAKLLMFAKELSETAGVELLVVHQAFSLAPAMGDAEIKSGIDLQSRRDALKKLSAYVSDAGANGPHVRCHVTTSNLDGALLSLQAMSQNDVIVVGIRSKSWVERLLTQGTAVKLVNAIQSVIVALPDLPVPPDLVVLHVAITPKYPVNHAQLRNLVLLNAITIKELRFLSVPSPEEDLTPLKEFLKAQCDMFGDLVNVSYEILQPGNVLAAIRSYMQNNQGVLVVQRGPRNFLDIFRKYFATDIIYDAQLPTIILP